MLPQARQRKTLSSHRLSSKVTIEADIAEKRARGELTCAECKRLKLKCDKVREYMTIFQLCMMINDYIRRNYHAPLASAGDVLPYARRAASPADKNHGMFLPSNQVIDVS